MLFFPGIFLLPNTYFFNYISLFMLQQLPQFSPFIPLHPASPLPQAIPPPLSMSMGHACMFFGYSIPVLYFTPSQLFCNYLFVLLTPVTSSPIPPNPLPSGNHQNVLCIYGPVSVLLVCLFYFLF